MIAKKKTESGPGSGRRPGPGSAKDVGGAFNPKTAKIGDKVHVVVPHGTRSFTVTGINHGSQDVLVKDKNGISSKLSFADDIRTGHASKDDYAKAMTARSEKGIQSQIDSMNKNPMFQKVAPLNAEQQRQQRADNLHNVMKMKYNLAKSQGRSTPAAVAPGTKLPFPKEAEAQEGGPGSGRRADGSQVGRSSVSRPAMPGTMHRAPVKSPLPVDHKRVGGNKIIPNSKAAHTGTLAPKGYRATGWTSSNDHGNTVPMFVPKGRYDESITDEKIQKKDKECNNQTGAGQLFKKGKTKEAKLVVRGRFMEAAEANDATREIDVIIIQEGLGNKRDMNFYTKEALEKSYKLFEGAQAYADHPTRTEESDRPERSIRELVGYYKNPQVIDYNNKKAIKATLKIMDGKSYDWIWDLVKEAVAYSKEYPDKDLVGISINASGVTEKDQNSADPMINYVKEVTDVFSSDVVTKPGAGGRIGAGLRESVQKYLEAKKSNLQEAGKFMNDALEKAITELETMKGKIEAGEVDAGAAPKAIDEIINSLKALMQGDEAAEGEAGEAGEAGEIPEGGEGAPEPDGDEGKGDVTEAAALAKENEELREAKSAAEQKVKILESKEVLAKMLRESHLPAGSYDDLKESLICKDVKYIKKAIEARRNFLASILKTKVDGNGEMTLTESTGKEAASIYDGLPKKK